MPVLVGYDSSDEEDEVEDSKAHDDVTTDQATATDTRTNSISNENPQPYKSTSPAASRPPESEPAIIAPIQQYEIAPGPSLPPASEAISLTYDTATALPEPDAPDAPDAQVPLSPYSANRALLRNLTLPALPDFDIPPSPPGSPPPETQKKFEQFLELKRKGTHFNAKLAASAALRNPSLADKLMDFVGLDEARQYRTTLSAEIWDPEGFPDWARRGPLKAAQEKERKLREAGRAAASGRSALEFVPASSVPSSKSGTPAGLSRGEKRKAGSRWD